MTLEDAWRSLKRLAAMALPEPWQIRLEAAQYSEEERPLVIIDTVGPMARTGVQPTIPGRQHVVTQTFLLTAYPAVLGDAREARAAAVRALRTLDEMVTIGLVDDTGKSVGGPLRLPLWDYAGVPLTGPARGNPNGQWKQMMWAESYEGIVLPDPQDDHRYTIPYTLRVSWDAVPRVRPPAPTLEEIEGKFLGEPDAP